MTRLALLHPGEMGASLGACAREAGSEVVWASAGRSAATRARAEADGLRDAGSLKAAVAESDVALSVCPPEFAGELARRVLDAGFRGLLVDANATRPAAARELAEAAAKAGADFVDGGIVGGPARRAGSTVLCLSGPRAADVAALFDGSPLGTQVLAGGPGRASALKMAYAAYSKGHAALLLDVRALARAEGVEAELLAMWERSQPKLAEACEGAARNAAPKAWRFGAEMEEIAATFAAAGLPDGFHRAAADLYERLAELKGADGAGLEDVLARLLREGGA